MSCYDVIVVGGGPGGYTAAVRASQLGMKTALVERENLGGTCANWGCIPTKSLLKNAEVAHFLHKGKAFGFSCSDITLNYEAAQTRSRQVARRQSKRVEALLKAREVDIIVGEAVLKDRQTVQIKSSGELLQAKAIILATGGRPRIFPGLEPDGERIITSREALALTECPASAAIIGAGPIGLELATVWQRYGCRVTVLEALPRILPLEDEDISKEAAAHFTKAGIKLRTGVRVQALNRTAAGVDAVISTADGRETISADMVLVAVGTAANIEDLGLEALGVAVERGRVVVDGAMRTNVPGIYAIGDLNGKLPLAHTASAQAVIAAEAIAGKACSELVYENIPRCVFGVIEVASVGLTEQQALDRGLDVKVAKSAFLANGKAVSINENIGFIKLVADKTGRLVGAHMTGPHVTEMIGAAATIIGLGITAEQASKVVYPHPTLSEAFMEGLHALAGHAIHQ